jgi:hypothetical protein
VQLLRRYNEAIALDYLIPMRILTPTQAAPSDSGTDPVLAGMGSAVFLDKILDMVQKKRKDPTAWFTLPFPVQFTSINEGVQMLRPDLIVQGLEDLLNGMGVPIEFYRGSLRWRGDPAAIRLMEKTWIHLTMSINSLLDWLTDVLSSFLNKERVDARLLPPSMYDDIARKQLLLQLAFNQKISDETAFAPWNINISQENELMAAEQKAREEAFAPPEEAQSLGAPVGSPQAAQMQQPQTLTDLEAVSKQIAQQLIAAPESLRTSQLISLKKTNKSLHAMVRMELDAIRQQSNLEGGVMLRQSQGMPG